MSPPRSSTACPGRLLGHRHSHAWCKWCDLWSDCGGLDPARVLLAPQGGRRPRALAGNRFLLLVGPEGGLDMEEAAAARLAGFANLSLGPRILRTETAGPAALAALGACCGDI